MKICPQNIASPTLLFRPHPFRTEGPNGFLLRLASDNMMYMDGLMSLGIAYDLELLRQQGLMPLPGLDPDLERVVALISNTLQKTPRAWNRRYCRFCPICLSEDSYWRSGWELQFHDACPKHGVWLIDQCSSCCERLSWNRESITRCQCGSDLRTEIANGCPEKIRKLSEVLLGKLLETETIPLAPVNKCDLTQTQRLILYLGTYMDPGRENKALKVKEVSAMHRSWSITSRAAEILFDWPNAFEKSLELIQKDVDQGGPKRLDGAFGRAYHYLYRGLKETAFQPIHKAFEQWFAATWTGGVSKRNRRLSGFLLAKAEWIPANLACQELGISRQRLKLLAQEGLVEIEIYIHPSGRESIMVRRDRLELIKDEIQGYIDMKTARILLGFGKRRMSLLLTKLFPNARRSAPNSPWLVLRSEVEALINLGDDLPHVSIPDEGDVSLSHILRYWTWETQEVFRLIDAVKNTEMKVVSKLHAGVGINGWIFNEKSLRIWHAKSTEGLGTWVSIPQMAKLIGIKEHVAYELVQQGFINAEVVTIPTRGGGKRVRRSDVERFKTEFVFATEIAQRLRISPRKARFFLLERNIQPVSGPGVDECRQLLYRRDAQVLSLLSSMEGDGFVLE